MTTKVAYLLQDAPKMFGAARAMLDLLDGLRKRSVVDARILLIEETRLGRTQTEFRHAIDERGIPCTGLPVRTALSPGLLRRVRARVRQEGIQVVHTVGPKATVHGCLALRGRGIPLVTTIHGWLLRPDPKERLHEWLEMRTLRHFDRVIVLSRYYQRLLVEKGARSERVVRIPSGMPPASEPPPAGRDTVPCVGMLGRFSSEKNHRMLLRVAQLLLERSVDVRFVLAGQGPEQGPVSRQARELGLEGLVQILPYTDPSEFMQSIDILALCSVIENLPYCVLEAMAWSRPVVATRVGGLPDLIEDGETGYLVELNDATAMADRIACFVDNPAQAASMGRKAREKLARDFSPDANLAAHEVLYRSLLSPEHRTPNAEH